MADTVPLPLAIATTRTRKRVYPGEWNQLERLWPRFGVRLDQVHALRPAVLEVGFGHGESLVAAGRAHPGVTVLGVELYTRGVIQAMRALEAEPHGEVRIVMDDAREVVAALPPDSLVAVNVLFPDPWPKRRQRHRRLLDRWFLELVTSRLQVGGRLHVASDWPDYLAAVAAVMADREDVAPVEAPPRLPTRFEGRARRDGRPVGDRAWTRGLSSAGG
jgi:tRNA (guanine-N7-)-methyltransferase